MNLKEKISGITGGYKAEVSRTKLLSVFLGHVAIREAEEIARTYDELSKMISGEIVRSVNPSDPRFISVPRKLLIEVTTPLKSRVANY